MSSRWRRKPIEAAVTAESSDSKPISTSRRAPANANCSYCWKVRAWTMGIKPDAFRLLSGKEHAREYGFREDSQNHHVFCGDCGVRIYTYGHVEEIGGDYVAVALSVLDDLAPAELAAAPVRYINGRDDDWFNVPAETRHL